MVKRNILALTLMGLMAAVLIFPVCANAQVDGEEPPTLIAPEADAKTYELMPTFEWSAASGPTKFELTIGSDAAITVDDGNVIDDPDSKTDPKEKKWDKDNRLAASEADAMAAAGTDDTKNCYTYPGDAAENAGKTICWYQYVQTTDMELGATTWKVKAIREGMPKDNFDGTANPTEAIGNLNLYDDVVLSLALASSEASVVQGTAAGVKVSVALDNSATISGGMSVDTLSFDIKYDGDAFAPADPAFEAGRGTPTVGNPSGSGASTTVNVSFAEAITAGTENVVTLIFDVKADATVGSTTFTLEEVAATSSTVIDDLGDLTTKIGDDAETVTLTVTKSVLEGDLDGDGSVTLADAVIALKVLVGLDDDLTPEEAASVNAHVTAHPPKVDAAVLVYILKTVAAG